ncbi:MAG: hypothetical protein FD135_2154 [Comamonadaceae bacterium]|nr:MAG: hypothetical protein FD135_2154 [Comamonadaceae bacterium]
MKHALRLFVIFLGLLPLISVAQWAWTDPTGRKIFSDRPPDASIPDKNIFKRPGTASNTLHSEPAANASAENANTSAKPVAAAPKVTGIDKELADRKKKDELAQAAQRKAEEDRINKVKADNCQRIRQAQKTLDSGIRISRANSQGEREILDDAARAAEASRLASMAAQDCR